MVAEAGLPIDGLAFRELDGRVYTTIVPLGGKARRPPPKALLPVLLKVVPELRRRVAASRAWSSDDRPAKIVDEWLGGKEDAVRAEGRRLIAIDADSLSGARLADLIDEAFAYATDAWYWHFRLHGAGVWQIGLLGLELEREHGWTDIEFAELFTGLSDASTAPGRAQDAILESIAAAEGLDALAAATSLDDVRRISTAVGRQVDDYLDTWGLRAVRYEIAYPTVAERPDWLLRQLQERHPRPHEDDQTRREEAEQKLYAALGDTEETRARLAAARRTFPVREGNEAATVGLPSRGAAPGRAERGTPTRAGRQPRASRRRVRPDPRRGHGDLALVRDGSCRPGAAGARVDAWHARRPTNATRRQRSVPRRSAGSRHPT